MRSLTLILSCIVFFICIEKSEAQNIYDLNKLSFSNIGLYPGSHPHFYDFNEDGYADAVFIRRGKVYYQAGLGNSSQIFFGDSVALMTLPSNNINSLIGVEDINEDGIMDLVLSLSSNAIHYLENFSSSGIPVLQSNSVKTKLLPNCTNLVRKQLDFDRNLTVTDLEGHMSYSLLKNSIKSSQYTCNGNYDTLTMQVTSSGALSEDIASGTFSIDTIEKIIVSSLKLNLENPKRYFHDLVYLTGSGYSFFVVNTDTAFNTTLQINMEDTFLDPYGNFKYIKNNSSTILTDRLLHPNGQNDLVYHDGFRPVYASVDINGDGFNDWVSDSFVFEVSLYTLPTCTDLNIELSQAQPLLPFNDIGDACGLNGANKLYQIELEGANIAKFRYQILGIPNNNLLEINGLNASVLSPDEEQYFADLGPFINFTNGSLQQITNVAFVGSVVNGPTTVQYKVHDGRNWSTSSCNLTITLVP